MPIVITENGKRKRISTQIGGILKLREKALKGDGRALDRLLELAARYNDEPAPQLDQPLSAEDDAILADYVARTNTPGDPSGSEVADRGSPEAVRDSPVDPAAGTSLGRSLDQTTAPEAEDSGHSGRQPPSDDPDIEMA